MEWIIGIIVGALSLAAAFFQGREKGVQKEQERQAKQELEAIKDAQDAVSRATSDPDEYERLRQKYKRPE